MAEPTALEHDAQLDVDIFHLYQTTRPSAAVLAARDSFLARLTTAIRSRYGAQYTIALFGSTAYGVSGAGSDLDVSVIDGDRPDGFAPEVDMDNLPYIYNPRNVAKALAWGGFIDVQPILASVPIVKLTDRTTGLQCDVNINDQFGVRNSRLLRAYLDLVPPARALAVAVKHWASRRGLNDPSASRGVTTFSSYTLALLLLGYLQTTGHLPNLQDPALLANVPESHLWARPPRVRQRRLKKGAPPPEPAPAVSPAPRVRCDTTFAPSAPGWSPPTQLTLAAGLRGFFAFYAALDFNTQAISIAEGGTIPRESAFVEPPEPVKKERKRKEKGKKKEGEASKEAKSPWPPLVATTETNGNASSPNPDLAASSSVVVEADIAQVAVRSDQLNADEDETLPAERTNSHLEDNADNADNADDADDADDQHEDDDQAGADDVVDSPEHGRRHPELWQNHLIITQDPFIKARNTSQNIVPLTARHIVTEFRRAHELLSKGTSLAEVCAEPSEPLPGTLKFRPQAKVLNSTTPRPPKLKKAANDAAPNGVNAKAPRNGFASDATSGNVRLGPAGGPSHARAEGLRSAGSASYGTPPATRCFVRGHRRLEPDALGAFLSARFGPVRSVDPLRGHGSLSFVNFVSVASAQAAVAASTAESGLRVELPNDLHINVFVDECRPPRPRVPHTAGNEVGQDQRVGHA